MQLIINYLLSSPVQLGEMIQKLEKTEENAKYSYDKYSMLVSQQTTNSEDTSQLKNVSGEWCAPHAANTDKQFLSPFLFL